MKRSREYVHRRSQITRQPPTARLKKRRRKNTVPGRFPNPRPVLYIITARAAGKGAHKMHFDGKHFSERAKVKLFPTKGAAADKAYDLVARFPVLKRYRIAVEDNRTFR